MSGHDWYELAAGIDVSAAILAQGIGEEGVRRVRRARTVALLQERAAIEWDVLSRISMRRRVRDVLGASPGPRCGQRRPSRAAHDVATFCTRREGHTGRHLMGAGAWVVAVWS